MPDHESKLIEFALKSLDKESADAVETEVNSSSRKRAELREIEEALNLLAVAEKPLPPGDNLRARLMDSIRQETRFAGFVVRLTNFFGLSETIIREHLAKLEKVRSAPWEINAFPGTHLLHFDGGPRLAAADCGLVYVEPGQMVAPHRHLGDEWSLILQGQKQEIGGSTYQAGDLMHRATGTVHSFRAVGGEPLIYAAILFEGMEFLED